MDHIGSHHATTRTSQPQRSISLWTTPYTFVRLLVRWGSLQDTWEKTWARTPAEAILAGEESPGSEPETQSSPTDSDDTLPEAPTHLCLEAGHSPNVEADSPERVEGGVVEEDTTPDSEPLPGRYSLRTSRRPPDR